VPFAYTEEEGHTSAYVSIRRHTSAYVSIRQHTSAYVSIRQHTSAFVGVPFAYTEKEGHTSAYVSIRQHTSVFVDVPFAYTEEEGLGDGILGLNCCDRGSRCSRQYLYLCTSKASKLKGLEMAYLALIAATAEADARVSICTCVPVKQVN
jgi:hypothetical protein